MDPAELEGANLVYSHPSSLTFCQPVSVLDLKQDFLASLRDDLTFNSRPVIMNLTQIAGENINAASTITKALEDHIQKVSKVVNVLFSGPYICGFIFRIGTDGVGTTDSQITRSLLARFNLQECRKSLSTFIRTKHL